VHEIVLPERNRANVVEDVPDELREGLTFHYVSRIEEALSRSFAENPLARRGSDAGRAVALDLTDVDRGSVLLNGAPPLPAARPFLSPREAASSARARPLMSDVVASCTLARDVQ